MAITNDQFLQSIYVAYWGRAADPTGFFYWDGLYTNGTLDFAGIAENFALSTEAENEYAYFKAYNEFGAGAITDTMRGNFVEQIYQNMFNRAADADGKAYWVEQLKSGAVSPGAFIATIADSAIQAAGDDAAVLENKAAAAEYFTNQLVETGTTWNESLSADFEAILAGVGADTDLATIQAEANTIISGAVGGETFSLTNSTVTGAFDNITGTSGNDVFKAGPATAETGDVLDGLGGTDRLNIQENASGRTMAPSMSAVEQVWLNNQGGTANTDTFSGANATGLTQVWADRIEDTDGGGDQDAKVAFTNIGKAVQLGVYKGASTAANRTDATFTLNDVTGSSDEATLVLDEASVNNVTIAGVETLNVKSQGDASSRVDGTLAAAAAKSLVFTGDQDVKIDALNIANANHTIDASAMTGGLTVTAEAGANVNTTFTGGTGDDALYMGDELAAGDSLDGGTGTNTIGITNAADLTAATGDLIKNFQVFDAAGATGNFDMDFIDGGGSSSTITAAKVSADLGGATTLTDLADGAGVTIGATTTAGLTVTQKGAGEAGSNDDVLSFDITNDADVTVNALTAAQIETINITSTATAGKTSGHTLTDGTFANATKLVFLGDEQLTVNGLTGSTAVTSIDGSAMTDKLVFGAAADMTMTTVVLAQGGSAADTLFIEENVQLAGSTLQGNGGADTLTIADAGANNKEMIIKYAAQSDSTGTTFDKVVGFENDASVAADSDLVDISFLGFTGAQAAVFSRDALVTVQNASESYTITEANAANFFNDAGVDKAVAYASDGTDTFLFIDADKNGDWDASNDMAIHLDAFNADASAFANADFSF